MDSNRDSFVVRIASLAENSAHAVANTIIRCIGSLSLILSLATYP